MSGRLADECDAVPVTLWKTSRRVDRTSGARGVGTVMVHLTDLLGDGINVRRIRRLLEAVRGPAAEVFVVAVGHVRVPCRVVVGG